MSFNGAGVFLINSAGQPVVSGTTITAAAFNAFTADVGTGLSTCITKDGQTTVTANIPLSSFKLTGLGAATANGDAVRYEQFLSGEAIGTCGLRLTVSSGVPVTTADTTSGTLYFTPYKGNRIALYDGTNWQMYATAEISIAVPAFAGQMYDVFCFANAGVPTLELLAWSSDTVRATAVVYTDGVPTKSGSQTRRYVGSFRTGLASTAVDFLAFRLLWNCNNRVKRPMRITDAAASWNYTNATYRQANANVLNQLEFVIGLSEEPVFAMVQGAFSNTAASVPVQVGVGLDVTNNISAGTNWIAAYTPLANAVVAANATWRGFPGVGRHFLAWIESSAAAGTTTFYGSSGGVSAMHGEIWS